MSRVGKQIIEIPQNVEVSLSPDGVFSVSGPQGKLERTFKPVVSILIEDKTIRFEPKKDDIATRSLWGTYASHVSNMINGVTTLFKKTLVIEGVGYKAAVQGSALVLNVGFSHPVSIEIPESLTVEVEKNEITVSGINKEDVGQFAGAVRSVKKPEPYKGKGIRYSDETIIRKQGKKSA